MPTLPYRPDIDGLRAVAVTLVVLFHAALGVSGGFVGVDVFFVVSGYLITGLILRDLEAGTFRLADFWTRRIRRLAPASACLTLAVLCAGSVLLFPSDFEELGKSAIAHPLLSANFFFWTNTGYFDGPAELKPLLHTWSLAVEEQFYLVYPLLLAGLARLSRPRFVGALAVLAAASLALSVWQVEQHPSAAYYLLPSRVWELLLGGLLCFAPSAERLSARWIQSLGLVGAAAIAASTWYTASTPFPGLSAALPCVGTVLLLYANGHRVSWIGRGLAWGPLVQVGRMSYSLYLWHWPILVFLRHGLGEDLSPLWRWLAVAASFLAAYLSWRFVETPFRDGAVWRRRRPVLAAFACATGVLVAVGWCIQQRDGFPERFSPELRQVLASLGTPRYQKLVPLEDVREDRLPEFGDQSGQLTCLLWGDSHAMALVPALDAACRDLGIRGYQATYNGHLPLLDFQSERKGTAPAGYAHAVFEEILADDYDVVILAGYWSRDSDDPRFARALSATVEQLTAAGSHVVLLRDVPIQQGGGAGSVIAAPLRQGMDLQRVGVMLEDHRRHQRAADVVFAAADGDDVTVADPAPYLTDAAQRCRIVMDGECLYSDRHHLSLAGARRLKPFFTAVLTSIQSSLAANDTGTASASR